MEEYIEMKDFLILLDDKYKKENLRIVNGKMVYSDDLLKRYNTWMELRNQRLWVI